MKKEKWSLGNKLWLGFAIIAVIFSSLLQKNTNYISVIASVFGVIYAILIMKNCKSAFLYGIGNVLLLGIILFSQKVYAGAFYNLVYSFPMLVWGYVSWSNKQNLKDSGVRKMSSTRHNDLIVCICIAICLYAIFLENIGANQVLFDATSAVLGYVGLYLMANKYIEQWNVWLISNLVNVLLWLMLSFQSTDNIPVLVMWIVYLLNSIYGYVIWKKKYGDTLKIKIKERKMVKD